ncbi:MULTISPECIES: type II toxin-antitoxin system Phd/YefM family antitoxin [Aquimarina]|uniref:Type II toxin-antitoxin system Phd/YefM family antitoxin n=1 Tax=Aquimarina algiphila TaxID=2047982 RepID=A0A554VIC0_9FLAO|nr:MULTISPECIES: type II toxin-antitoxin system Phd/YefM family antitoxin [Aquimarina]TSE07414.1 type II toxin-antitoxin system Phd/YefM family antitoxin [Aquimarina algiphila]
MFSTSDVHTVTEFFRNPSDHIKRLSISKKPEVLTLNGKAAIVVQDAASYERMAELADYAESLMQVKQALSEEGRPIETFTQEFEKDNGITR